LFHPHGDFQDIIIRIEGKKVKMWNTSFLLTYHTTGESMLPLNTSSHIAPNKGFGVIAKERVKSGKGG